MLPLAIAMVLIGCDAPPAPGHAAPAPLALVPIGRDDAAGLAGELRCGFAVEGRPLLVAAADVGDGARSDAAVRVGGAAVMLAGEGAGGFDALERGGTFAGGGVRARLVRSVRVETGTEESRHAATLTVSRGNEERRYDGMWSCGP